VWITVPAQGNNSVTGGGIVTVFTVNELTGKEELRNQNENNKPTHLILHTVHCFVQKLTKYNKIQITQHLTLRTPLVRVGQMILC
jgi:hypothetical protein